VGGQLIQLNGVAIGLGVSPLIVRQVDGGLALQAQPYVLGLFLKIDLRERQGHLWVAGHVRLLRGV
jgi:hypothetical protein